MSSTALVAGLLELEREVLVSNKIYPEIPLKVEYRLTVRANVYSMNKTCFFPVSFPLSDLRPSTCVSG
ncbi:MAG: hypothetical protein DLM72_02665 [Candidatus Nitrosopolaris wilkensis]|nr:MAG: hypothetical protein DLM72_02665 [Candidatus Nitrosopolaris wilkensis]